MESKLIWMLIIGLIIGIVIGGMVTYFGFGSSGTTQLGGSKPYAMQFRGDYSENPCINDCLITQFDVCQPACEDQCENLPTGPEHWECMNSCYANCSAEFMTCFGACEPDFADPLPN